MLQDLFAGTGADPKPGSAAGAAESSAAVPGPVFRQVLAELQPDVAALLTSMDALVEACAGKYSVLWEASIDSHVFAPLPALCVLTHVSSHFATCQFTTAPPALPSLQPT